jgi:predicted Zn-dependent peptidase
MSKPFTPEVAHLSNGIPVILQNYEGPVAATYWWVKTGSADEIGPQAGFAHFLEHMLFKDTAAKETGKASTGQTARAIESLGGDINAYTSFDQTVYHVTCAAHHWEKVIDAFAPMSKPQKFLKQDFDREREVILEEPTFSKDVFDDLQKASLRTPRDWFPKDFERRTSRSTREILPQPLRRWKYGIDFGRSN